MLKLHQLYDKGGPITWGLPHKKGTVFKDDCFYLETPTGNLPVVSAATAYWEDESVKWSLHSAVLPPDVSEIRLKRGNIPVKTKLTASETDDAILVNTGRISAVLPKNGEEIIKSISTPHGVRCTSGSLKIINEQHFSAGGVKTHEFETFRSKISECCLEECNDIRAVVHIRGTHIGSASRKRNGRVRELLPFEVRLYFYAGCDEIRIVHTFLFDAQPQTDFIHGIALVFKTPISGELYNRHVRFVGESGVFCDSPKDLLTWRTVDKYKDMYEQQLNCRQLSFEDEDEMFLSLLDESAVWNDFKLVQLSSEEYRIEKRVGDGLSYICGNSGKRSLGAGGISDKDGGFFVYIDKFSEKYPSSISCTDTAEDTAVITAWLWPEDAPSMDMRHYDTRCHVQSAYEGFDELRATPYGIANTNELCLKITDSVPSNEELYDWAKNCSLPSLLVPDDLDFYRQAGVLGEWSLPDRSTDEKCAIEDQLDALFDFYKNEVEQRRWYGFWDFGDFMHTYNDTAHCWKYDMGGQAWQNTELVPNLWLWYSFLRTGRADYFEAAKAMTRHTSEVDMYHIGEYAGLGSRHNVRHWGCGCKEVRISMAGLHKIFAYLTGDERVLDIMDEVVDADEAIGRLDPMRAYYPPSSKFKTHVRFGPDVMAFCSNWFTCWERHLDKRYLDKLQKTLSFFKKDHRFILSGVYGYDPSTTEYYDFEVDGGSHFMLCFGNLFVWLEIAKAFGDSEIMERLYDLGQCYGNNDKDIAFRHELCEKFGFKDIADTAPFVHASYNVAISMLSAVNRNNEQLKAEIVDQIFNDPWAPLPLEVKTVNTKSCHKILTETAGMNTNGVSQWATNVIIAAAYI